MVRRLAVLTLGVAITWTSAAEAQYFGRNKVRYEDFNFRILETPHFDVYHYPEAEEAVRFGGRLAERWYARLARALDHEFDTRQPLVFYASYTHFAQSTIIPGFVAEGVGGVTEHLRGRVVMPFAPTLGETDHVLGHELVHAFQRDILQKRGRSMALLPLWFVEGMAEYLSTGHIDANTAMWLRDAAADGKLPTLEQLEDPRYFPYRYGQALWAYLADRFGEGIVAQALKSSASGGAIGRLTAVTGLDAKTLTKDWHAAIRAMLDERERPNAKPLISRRRGGGRLNIGPALSPDGRDVVFLSERDQFSVDVYLADAQTGAIKRRLVQTAADPHFESLQFIGSAGAWDRRGERFVMAAIHEGQPVVTVLEMPSGRTLREYLLPNLDEVLSPSWSPDGTRLVFSALAGGFTDLYVLDLKTGQLQALTSDAFADLQPAWSPDGRTVAFATDRYSSSLDTLGFGTYELAAIDVASGGVRRLPNVPGGKNINPQWSADGESLYFVADGGDRSNVYRVHLSSGDLFRVTDVPTGVSGITALSPALSVAAAAPRLAFGVYRHGAYEVHAVDAATDAEARVTKSGRVMTVANAMTPGLTPWGGAVQPPTFGLVDGRTFELQPYKGGLSLDRIGQPYLSAGGGAFGSFFRAGMSFSFGDMLGEHSLRTAFQVGSSLADLGLQAAYVNRQSRWNWAIVGEQVGSRLGATRRTFTRADAGSETWEDEIAVTRIHRGLSAVAMYPFNRSRRVELSVGANSTSFMRQTKRSVYAEGGELMNETADESSAPTLLLFQASGALVHDSSVNGPAGPVLGQRFRFEVSPYWGELTFARVVADYRRYVMPAKPFTLAFRVKHTGRYGSEGTDTRLLPMLTHLRDTVRGYSLRDVSAGQCSGDMEVSCSPLFVSTASQLAAANVELRFPLFGFFNGRTSYGPLPMEGFAFADSAWLWSADRAGSADRRWSRTLLRSVGAGVRLNARGFIFELAGARALDAHRGWRFAVNFGPGF